jgi:hypothetical protein
MFTTARHLSLSWAKWIQSTSPSPISLRSILICPPIYAYVFLVVSSLQASQPKCCMHPSPPPCAPHDPPISSSLPRSWCVPFNSSPSLISWTFLTPIEFQIESLKFLFKNYKQYIGLQYRSIITQSWKLKFKFCTVKVRYARYPVHKLGETLKNWGFTNGVCLSLPGHRTNILWTILDLQPLELWQLFMNACAITASCSEGFFLFCYFFYSTRAKWTSNTHVKDLVI